MDSYKFLHFFYDLSNLQHFTSLQSAFLFTSRHGLSQNVKGLREGKRLAQLPALFTKGNTLGSADMGRIKPLGVYFHQKKVQRGKAREAPGQGCALLSVWDHGPRAEVERGGCWAAPSRPHQPGWGTGSTRTAAGGSQPIPKAQDKRWELQLESAQRGWLWAAGQFF